MKYCKLAIIYFCRTVLKVFWIVPVKKNRIFLSSDRGSGIRCNPLYIFKYMQKEYSGEFEYIWEYDGEYDAADTRCVKPKSLTGIYYQLTSKVLISNDGFGSFLPKRKQQIFINTWHGGGAYKKSGVDFVTDQHPVDLKINKICGQRTDIFISGCEKFSEVMSTAKMVPRERFLECGMPRNDILIRGADYDVTEKVKKFFGVDKDVKLVLFAPTYRGEENEASFHSQLDVSKCVNALENRFGGRWVMLMRKHHFVKDVKIQNCIDASGYPDMQELLYACDAFITDYSSAIWDFSLTYKPGFLFVPDLDEYQKERSFYTDPMTWAYPLALSNDELCERIKQFDEAKNELKIDEHHELLGNKETGRACEIIAEKIYKLTLQ